MFSKGHASPLLYAMFKAAGVISDDELVNTYRRAGSRLEGIQRRCSHGRRRHRLLGQSARGSGSPAGKFLDKLDYHVWALCGDSEMAEGSMWRHSTRRHMAWNLIVIAMNRLGQTGETEFGWDLNAYKRRVEPGARR